MFFIKLTALYFLIYGVLFLSGWGICVLLCKGKNEKYKSILSPIIGIIPLSCIPMYFSFLGVKTLVSAWVTLIIFVSISLYCLIKSPPNFKKKWASFFLLLFVIIGVCPSFTVILKAGYLTSTLQSYPTFIIYLAEFFSQNSALETTHLDFNNPFTNILFETSQTKPVVGYLFFIASISSILGLPPYKLYLVLSGIVGSFIPISVYIACKEGFKLEKKIALLISFLVSINISYFFWPIIGHFPFVTGIAFLILGLGFMRDMLQCKKRTDYVFYSLIMAGIMSMYFQLAPYIIGVALLYIFILSCMKIPQNTLKSIKNIGIISLLTFAITPFVFIFIAQRGTEFTATTSKFTKNVPRYPYLEELFGFGQHFSMHHDGSLKYYLILLFAIILILFICAGLYNCFKNRNILFLSICGFIFTLGTYFSLIDFTYHFYKNSIIGVFMITSALVIGGDFLYKKINYKLIKVSIVAVLLIFIALNVNTYAKIALKSSHPIITKSYIDLENISNVISGDKLILVNSRNPTEEAWLSFFLKDNKIKLKGSLEPWGFWIFSPLSGKPNFNFFYDYKKDSIDFTLSPRLKFKTDIVETDYGETVYENEDYILSKNLPNPYLLKGWYNLEKDKDGVFRWTQKECSIIFNKPVKDSVLYIKGTIPAVYKEPVEIAIILNGKIIDKFRSGPSEISKKYSLNMDSLKELNNELSIVLNKSFIPNELWDTTDLRKLGIIIRKIEISPL